MLVSITVSLQLFCGLKALMGLFGFSKVSLWKKGLGKEI